MPDPLSLWERVRVRALPSCLAQLPSPQPSPRGRGSAIARRLRSRRAERLADRLCDLHGQLEIEAAAGAERAIDADVAAVFAHDLLADGQPQAGAARALFRLEDREDPLLVLGRDPLAIV